jgi:hypothetical protein
VFFSRFLCCATLLRLFPKKIAEKIQSLGLNEASLFETGNKLKNDYYVKRGNENTSLSLSDEKLALIKVYHNDKGKCRKSKPNFFQACMGAAAKVKTKTG